MGYVIDLGGKDWAIREALGETWRWRLAGPEGRDPDEREAAAATGFGNSVAAAARCAALAPGWLPARVPGAVIDDLARCGELPDPYHSRQSRSAEWVAERHWVYSRTVRLDPRSDDETAVLEFDGIDPGGSIWWDGVELARTAGIYTPLRVRLDPSLSGPGRHTLAVVVDPAPENEPQVGRSERVRIHGPRMGYGWDFCPRLPHQGIWKGARVVVSRHHLADLTVAAELDPGPDPAAGDGRVRIAGTIEGPGAAPYGVRILGPDGDMVARAEGSATGRFEVALRVPRPALWWPNGFGPHPLYRVRLELDGREAGSGRRVGFRRIRFERNAGATEDALAYTVIVNGEPVPLVGWNWAPADALYGTIRRERLAHLVGLAEESGARLLRVWGGGLIETEDFYDECDERGILVWQEFSQSSSGVQSAPAEDAGFVAMMRAEAERLVPALAHHPSLAIWGGGNELDAGGVPLDEDRSPVLAALRDVVRTADPARHWLPTSPSGPEFHNRLDRIALDPSGQHDVHGPWEHQGLREQYELADAGTSMSHSEFGVEGMTNRRSLRMLIDEGDRWPADRSSAVYRHLGEWWNNAELVQAVFGGRLDNVEGMRRASQFLQATGLQYAVEADRRRWPRCSIVLPWQLAESYPTAWCTSAVDYRGEAKPAFDAVRRAFEPRRVAFTLERPAWAGHDRARATAWVWSEAPVGRSRVVVRARALDGRIVSELAFELGDVHHPLECGTLELPLDALAGPGVDGPLAGSPLFLWEAEWRDQGDRRLDRERVLATRGPDFSAMLDLPSTRLTVDMVEPGGSTPPVAPEGPVGPPGPPGRSDGDDRWRVRIANRGAVAALGVRLIDARDAAAEGWLTTTGAPGPLLPGESREIRVDWRGGDPASRVLELDSWNAERREIRHGHDAR